MGRECKVVVAPGMKGCGKSVETIGMLDEIVAGNPYTGLPPRKALIYDANDEFGDFWFHGNDHRKIKALSIKQLPLFTASNYCEIRRIRPFNEETGLPMSNQELMEGLSKILSIYRCGALLVEDPTRYISDSISAELIGRMATVRHISVDLVLHYQSIGKVAHPQLFGNTNYIRLHKTSDSVSRHDSKFMDKTELFMIAENIVNWKYFEEHEERFFLWIDNDRSKIHPGRITFKDVDVERAIQAYIDERWAQLSKPYRNAIDMTTNIKKYSNIGEIRNALSRKYRSMYF